MKAKSKPEPDTRIIIQLKKPFDIKKKIKAENIK